MPRPTIATFRKHAAPWLAAAVLTAAAPLAQAQSTQGVTESEILVGTHLAMSGPAAAWGLQLANGIVLRFEEVNAKGGVHGRKLKLVVEDHQFNPARAAQVGNKLLYNDKVFAILGALGTPMNMVVMAEAAKANVPNLFPSASGKQMYEPFSKINFALFATHHQNMRAGMRYMVETKGKKVVCTLVQDNAIGAEIVQGVADQLAAMKMQIVAQATHKPTDKEFSAQISTLKAANCDLIVIGGIISDTILPMATARRLNWNVDFIGSSTSYAPETAALAQGATDGLYATAQVEMPYAGQGPDALQAWFKRYRERFGADPGFQAVSSYIGADLFIKALEDAGRDLTVATLVAALEKVKDYRDPLASGTTVSFSAKERLGTSRVFIAQIQNGRWKRVSDDLAY